MLEWMYWSKASVILTLLFALMLIIMALIDRRGLSQYRTRRGFLRTETTFGERVFLAIVAFIITGIVWIAIFNKAPIVIAGVIGIIIGAIIVKWG